MKYTHRLSLLSVVLFACTGVACAQVAEMPAAPKDMVAPGSMPAMPCQAEMKAAMKNMPKGGPPTADKKGTPVEDNSKEGKALRDCMKKNAPKAPSGGQAAKVQPGTATAPIKKPTTDSANPAAQKPSSTPQTQQCVTITKELKITTQDAEVIALKKFLIAEGILKGVQSTNYFGPATETALKAWQKKKGITQTGVTDVKTRAALKACSTSATKKK